MLGHLFPRSGPAFLILASMGCWEVWEGDWVTSQSWWGQGVGTKPLMSLLVPTAPGPTPQVPSTGDGGGSGKKWPSVPLSLVPMARSLWQCCDTVHQEGQSVVGMVGHVQQGPQMDRWMDGWMDGWD